MNHRPLEQWEFDLIKDACDGRIDDNNGFSAINSSIGTDAMNEILGLRKENEELRKYMRIMGLNNV